MSLESHYICGYVLVTRRTVFRSEIKYRLKLICALLINRPMDINPRNIGQIKITNQKNPKIPKSQFHQFYVFFQPHHENQILCD